MDVEISTRHVQIYDQKLQDRWNDSLRDRFIDDQEDVSIYNERTKKLERRYAGD